ncbi:MAG: aminoglycoside 6-adenylyltransferase [Gaiellaceae bacterium]
MEGRTWILALPTTLATQRGLLLRLLDAAEADSRFRALELQCSLARGAADELSDADAGLWAADDAWNEAVAAVPALLRTLGEIVDVLEQPQQERPYFFVQYDDGSQLDLVVLPASRCQGRAPQAVVLLDRDRLLREPWEPRSLRAGPAELREWAFLAWLALANLTKYLRRGSLWEARAQLEEARAHLLRLHAARLGIAYPGFGLTSVLDAEAPLPAGLETTVAGLDADGLQRAAGALADLLDEHGPPPLAGFVRARLR